MSGTTMDPNGVQRGSKGWCVKCIGQINQLSTNAANNRTTAKARNRDIVGQHHKAIRGGCTLHKR